VYLTAEIAEHAEIFKAFFLSVLSDLSGEHLCFFFDQTEGSRPAAPALMQLSKICFTNQRPPAEPIPGPFEGTASYPQLVVADFILPPSMPPMLMLMGLIQWWDGYGHKLNNFVILISHRMGISGSDQHGIPLLYGINQLIMGIDLHGAPNHVE
jgi:hypothetical protein